jgi:hypothetical protein
MPLSKPTDLVSKWDYFYERSLGCVGVLKDWLTRSLALAIEAASQTLSLNYLERRALSVSQCTAIFNEIIMGEKELEESVESLITLRTNLGLPMESTQEEQENSSVNKLESLPSVSPTKRKRRPGARKPVRDKIRKKIA